ncbi:hypothetical protein [Paenibacillus elgii]|uniref:hypothetical protein n=1 Tax=Paenibacillus elgii TaxID=189691 RepID=UPI00203ED4E5|nr:hypothetical protein [Paenibacillus elgii]MCM3271156.1 hypothetical protein [Paenibacillus elgii]
MEFETKRKEIETKLKSYNEILKRDGEHRIVDGYEVREFDVELYKEKIRPFLYQDYQLLDQSVKNIVREIDTTIAQCEREESIEMENHMVLCNMYFKLIRQIEESYYN